MAPLADNSSVEILSCLQNNQASGCECVNLGLLVQCAAAKAAPCVCVIQCEAPLYIDSILPHVPTVIQFTRRALALTLAPIFHAVCRQPLIHPALTRER